MPLDVVPELFAFALERIILLAQGFVLVPPELLFIGICRDAGGQRLKQIGGVMQIGGVLPIGHQAGEAAQKMRRFGDVWRRGDRAGITHATCLLKHLSARCVAGTLTAR